MNDYGDATQSLLSDTVPPDADMIVTLVIPPMELIVTDSA